MSIQWNISKGDQRSERSTLEQLWYTWSAVGLGPLSAGFRIRAASRGLSDVSSPHVQALDRYLRFVLPAGTDPFAITPDMAPICLSLIQTEQGEWILVNKTYIGKDGVGRPGAFFVHLLSNLPPDFSAPQAISLWRSPFLRSSDIDQSSGDQLNGVQLDSVTFDDLKQWIPREIDIMHPKGINSSWVYDCFPLVIRAYLMWRKRWEQWKQQPPIPGHQGMPQSEPPRLYIAAPSDMVAAFIQGITCCLPQQLLTDLTFSTYEYDVRSKGQVLLAGTTWAPSPDDKTNANQDLPSACYQEGVAINCYNYNELKTQLELDPFAISFAAYATQCLVTDSFLELDWLFSEKIVLTSNLNVSSFLQAYDSYIVKAQNPTQKDVELFLDNADADMLSRVHVQDLILRLAMHDLLWLNNFLRPSLMSLYKQSKAKSKLANSLAQLAKAASHKAAETVNTDDIIAFDAVLSVMCQIADSKSEVWRIQPSIFAAQPNIQSFLTKYSNARFQLLELWNQSSPPLNIGEVRPFLNVPERNFEAFYSLNLPPEWKYIATEVLVISAIAQDAVLILGQKYQHPVAALMQHLSQNSWPEALTLFKQLAERNYPDTIRLLSLLLDSANPTKEETEALLKKAHLESDKHERFLTQYGPQYLLSPQKKDIVLKLFKTFAKDVPNRKMLVLDNWLKSASLINWFETPFTGPVNLDEVLHAASLAPDESNGFIISYGKHYLERYSQQSPAYQSSPLLLDYLKRYVNSFNPKSLWQPSSAALEFLLYLGNSPLLQSLSERERHKVQQYYSFRKFLQRPSTKITDVRALGSILHEMRFDGDLQLIESLAEAFASYIEGEAELASVTYMMSTLITEAELLQMLYTMAEYVRDGMVDSNPLIRERAEVLLGPYIELALCFGSVYDLSSGKKKIAIRAEEIQSAMKENLFFQTFLSILLQNARQNTIDSLNERSNESDRKYWRKWDDYKPLHNSTPVQEFLGGSPERMQPPRPIHPGGRSHVAPVGISDVQVTPPRPIHPGGRSHYNLSTFFEQPSTSRKEIEALRNMLPDRRSMRDSEIVGSLAQAFASCVESGTELTAVTQVLSSFITKADLLQMLYAMAEIFRDNLANSETKRIAESLLEPYIRFILCFESVYELSPTEHVLFVRTFLNLLLQSADYSTFQKLDIMNWSDKFLQKWPTYMPRHYATYLMRQNDSQNGQRLPSSAVSKQPSHDFFTTANGPSSQKQEVSTGRLPKLSNWFTRLKDWLAEGVFAESTPRSTALKRQTKETTKRR